MKNDGFTKWLTENELGDYLSLDNELAHRLCILRGVRIARIEGPNESIDGFLFDKDDLEGKVLVKSEDWSFIPKSEIDSVRIPTMINEPRV